MKAEAILIHRPERQHPARRALFTTATLVAWMAWMALWLPLATLVAWALGFRVGYVEVVVREHGHGGHDLATLLALALACGFVMAVWASYNYLRFAGVDRRRHARSVERRAIATALGVHQATATWMQHAPRMVLEFPEGEQVVHRMETDAVAQRLAAG
ncbi:poly-beta-1,6-N-acetyl-D-glucosamine biosynthesis protein PgaD [Dyella sp. BiH032]|uniref:poly-beta-1,6-N-acetyl-D-glucosamine biosynthesis protein PgaD n=1 Tax=Dyella sp. BiH032 TaxID=3075430 RepID=UPI002892A2CB|nr:poly-beta-1,6-N-acetyl-D-glucosamine biosynthesis protein PgaD [Dyella sp. BiH032]WNL45731.1 poly-beta-1,6-N-acetyl-D-glucosamine biosynthesis protein PgaD [Dyella sp. BiH032]